MSEAAVTHLDLREDMLALGDELVAEFSGMVPAEAVREYVRRCRANLMATGVRHGLLPATEAAVRVSLVAAIARGRASAELAASGAGSATAVC